MKILLNLTLAAIAAMVLSPEANAQSRAQYESMVASHASANNVPEALVHRVIVRESKYHPNLVGRGGTIGLMQIKLATARGLGYTGDAAGLRNPDTNLAWGAKYLAGAYRAANGDHSRAVHYYASGYYYAAKRQRPERPLQIAPMLASEAPQKSPRRRPATPADANALQTANSRIQSSWSRSQPPLRAALRPGHDSGAVPAMTRVDTPSHRLTLEPFRGVLREELRYRKLGPLQRPGPR